MRKTSITLSSLALLSACASIEPASVEPEMFQQAVAIEEHPVLPVEIVESVTALPLPGQMKPVDTRSIPGPGSKPSAAASPREAIQLGREGALIEPSTEGYVNAIQIYPYTEGALYRVYTSPGQISDIALQAGEELVSVSAGDTVRWVVGDTRSGSGTLERSHVLVKPISAGIQTNLMIATDRRTYHLELESVEGAYMAALSWRYPADEIAELTKRNSDALRKREQQIGRGLDLEALNFDYQVSGDRPAWRPLNVFDDGRQVFIQMPASIETGELPPLFLLGQEGGSELVNYRIRGNFYVVDQLFRVAELRLGARRQSVVRITRGAKNSPLMQLFGG